ncbi:chromosome partitioning protein [Salinibacter ruber]|uniref:Chromosome partitioning protein n=1 Tax=Salinibacter ruber TaxID=146919 RepID=A0A9X2TFP0_9BACT|nr:ParA family protein [Salinibacter ruber]MCS3645404.1 chromosome partitioning protein [Salinibacter ruber]MCS3679244.1 chromosome partitioning protein [Salinibacter ruber]MCS3682550.1 chromosome partitioning protein [Salinibacter ruber]
MGRIALINNKGGVGKTTTATHLADGFVREGRDALLVDLDAQASASLSLGCEREDLEPSIATCLYEEISVEKVIRTPPGSDVDLITGSARLQNADVRLAGELGRERILQEVLKEVDSQYDHVILDCPPSLSLIPINAIVASDWLVVPVEPHYLALEGVGSMLDTVESIKKEIGDSARLLGIVVTRADFRAKATKQAIEMLRREHGDTIFDTVVRGNVRVSEASSYGTTVFNHSPNSTGAEAYHKLTKEVLNRLDQ